MDSKVWRPYRPYSIVLLMVWQLVSVRPLQRRVFTIQKICSYGIQFYVVVYFVLRCWCSHLLCQVVFIFHSILCICLVVYLCICVFVYFCLCIVFCVVVADIHNTGSYSFRLCVVHKFRFWRLSYDEMTQLEARHLVRFQKRSGRSNAIQ